MIRDGLTWLLFHRSNIPDMRWKATVIVRLFQYMSFIWSVNNNNFFSLKYVELCAAIPVKNYLENSGWEVLPPPPYSPELAPSDYHLFRSMQNALTGIRFTSEQSIKNWLDLFLATKPAQFFWDRIHKLRERWEKVIASDRQYFE